MSDIENASKWQTEIWAQRSKKEGLPGMRHIVRHLGKPGCRPYAVTTLDLDGDFQLWFLPITPRPREAPFSILRSTKCIPDIGIPSAALFGLE